MCYSTEQNDLVIRFKGTEQEKQLREVQKKFTELYNSTDVDIVGETTEGTQYAFDNNQNLVYNGSRGERYVRTDEFKRLQAECQGMSDEDIQLYHSGNKQIDEKLRADIARVLRAQIYSYRNGLRDDNGILSLINKGNEFNTIAMQPVNNPGTQQGDTKSIFDGNENSWAIAIADENADGGYRLIYSGSNKQVKEYERIHGKANDGFDRYVETYQSNKRRYSDSLWESRIGESSRRNSEFVEGKQRTVERNSRTTNDEYVRSDINETSRLNESEVTNRLRQTENLYTTLWDKAGDVVSILGECVDSFTSQTIKDL